MPGGCTMYIQAPDVCWNKPFKVACSEKYDEWLGTVGIYEKTAAGNLKATPRRSGFLILGQNYPRRSSKNLSQAARWTFLWTDRKTTWSIASRKVSLVTVDDHCFVRSQKFWVNHTQILLNVPALMSRKHIRRYIFWTRIIKRTVTLKLSELYSLYVLQ